ncbi:Non-structural maintenance of chromosomes element 4 [Mycena sanguinolenta]|uniref:Non-structural maintenance of chromosomes element 4 n=1 Tax=Mycena sanguinolenta TaxID=230812 RepID=A0A8H6ZIN4_9AGAR|nr:Non-structural maintenance of chromosomes element 4 [Mycena sanguinolenta]
MASNSAPYDPDQDPEERRVVRKGYRTLAKSVEEHQHNLNEYSAQQLTDQVKKADELFNRVKGPQEATLDSAFLLMASNMGAQKARAMKSGSGSFDIDDFVSKLVTFMGGAKQLDDDSDGEDSEENHTSLEWDRIGRRALAKSRRVPAMGFMLGPLSIEQKKRNITKRAKFEKDKADMRAPQEIKEEDIARAENETTKNVATLEALLVEEEGPVNLFEFVINPNDFAQSVENIFYLSFLIRDGKVALETQEDGQVVIYICEQPGDSDYMQGLKKRQIVLEFDKATWQRAKEVFKITKSKIPQRPPARTKIGGKWYG